MKTYPMVSFRINEQFRKTVQREAKRRGISVSKLVKEALIFYLDGSHKERLEWVDNE